MRGVRRVRRERRVRGRCAEGAEDVVVHLFTRSFTRCAHLPANGAGVQVCRWAENEQSAHRRRVR